MAGRGGWVSLPNFCRENSKEGVMRCDGGEAGAAEGGCVVGEAGGAEAGEEAKGEVEDADEDAGG